MMASGSTIQACLTITHHDSCECTNIQNHDEAESETDMKRSNFRFSRGHALLRKQIPRSIVFQSQRTLKRRFTFPGNQDKNICKKRRRFTSIALPTKFLLGGNISDPLNLRSLEDEKVNQQLNACTPASSPMPMSRHRTQVQVLIPPNIYDPLNLNTGEEIEFNLLSAKPRKRRRHRKNRREDTENEIHTEQFFSKAESCESPVSAEIPEPVFDSSESELTLDTPSASSEERVVPDKIVSPVVPQGSPAKFFKRYHSRSFSKDADEKPTNKQIIRRRRSKTRLQRKVDYVKFRANAEKFCYGNHLIRQINLDDLTDQRLIILRKGLFCDKYVMDIGCNTGELTIFIAKHWKPHKITGIDIDKKLINIAQRKIREFKSKCISEDFDFPEAMTSMYGPLAKVGFMHMNSPPVFPNNILFFEANYVPGCEDCLETQRPELDIILCLRVTKWIHLNFGDDGLKLAFKRMFAQLKFGGYLILEPQPWFTYSASKNITPSIYSTYCSLKMRPEMFCNFLLSEEVGFSSCELIGRTYNSTKVYRQPLYLLTKGFRTSCRRNNQMDVLSTIPFHSDQWNHFR